MLADAHRERIANWVSDFWHRDAAHCLPGDLDPHGPGLLTAWLEAACTRRGLAPEDLELVDLQGAMLEHLARLDVPASVHAAMPDACRELLADLENNGRLEDGRTWGLALAAQRAAYLRATRGEAESISRPGPKLRRNEPCPCGSGKKFKQCCLRA